MQKLVMKKEDVQALKNCLPEKKSTQEVLKNLHFSGKYLYASDGKIALSIEEKNYNTEDILGPHKIIAVNKHNSHFSEVVLEKADYDYPEIGKMFAEVKKENGVNGFCFNDDLLITKSVLRLFKDTDNAFRYTLFEKLQPLELSWTVYDQGKDKAVYLEAGKYAALLMPFDPKL